MQQMHYVQPYGVVGDSTDCNTSTCFKTDVPHETYKGDLNLSMFRCRRDFHLISHFNMQLVLAPVGQTPALYLHIYWLVSYKRKKRSD